MTRRPELVVAVGQPECVGYDVAANSNAHAAAIRTADARVVVFPELSLTGYELDAPVVPTGDPRLDPIIDACAATGSLAFAGAPVAGPDGLRQLGMLAIDATGSRVVYAKMWLGGAEPDHFSPGAGPAVVEVDGWRLGLAICKDTRIPEHATATAALSMDVYVAGMLEAAEDGDIPAERAGRVTAEHSVWVAIASFAGSTGGGYERAAGGSGIWRPDGRPAARAGSMVGELVRATLS